MSIYATLWSIQIQDPASPSSNPRWVTVTAQAVPPHIGSPTPGCGYENGDPYGDFLPPPVNTNEDGEADYNRAIVFITDETKKGTARNGQEYVDPLLVLRGEEYAKMPFQKLLVMLEEAIRSGPRVVAEYFDSEGQTHIIRDHSQPHKIWEEQCEAAIAIEAEFGTEKALSYLIGEKFINFLEASETDADFRTEMPSFVDKIKKIFERWQLAEYLEKARQMEPFDPSVYEDEESADFENQLDIRKSAAELLLVERAKVWLLGEGE